MLRRLAIVALALAAAAVAGCDGDDACVTDGQCGAGTICQAGACANLCVADGDCTAPRLCEDGVCGYPSRCAGGRGCPRGEVCEAGLCRGQTPECALSSDCPPSFRCCEGGCYPQDAIPAFCSEVCRDDADCPRGETCLEGACAGERDVWSAADPDVYEAGDPPNDVDDVDDLGDPLIDVPDDRPLEDDADSDTDRPDLERPEIPDTADPDSGCSFDSDCPDGWVCQAEECRLEPTDVEDICEGRGDGQLGERCTGSDDCCGGLCFGNPDAGRGVCSAECSSWRACNPVGAGGDELFCYRHPELVRPLCALSDYGASCFGADDCVGQRCLVSATRRACSHPCATTADCAPGSACGLVNFDVGGEERPEFVCTPIGATPCRLSSDCLSGTCLYDDDTGVSYCSTICNFADPGACPAGFECADLPVSPSGSIPVCTLSGS